MLERENQSDFADGWEKVDRGRVGPLWVSGP